MADPPEYFYHVSNRKEMSYAKIVLLNTFKFYEQPLLAKQVVVSSYSKNQITFWGTTEVQGQPSVLQNS